MFLVKLGAQGPWSGPHQGSKAFGAVLYGYCFCETTGTPVCGPSSESLGLVGRERMQLGAPVCPKSTWSSLNHGNWWVDARVATVLCSYCQCVSSATWG